MIGAQRRAVVALDAQLQDIAEVQRPVRDHPHVGEQVDQFP